MSDPKLDWQNEHLAAHIILQNIEDGVFLVAPDQRLALYNPAAGRITGFAPGQALGRPWSEILHFTDRHGQQAGGADDPVKTALDKKQTVRQDDAYILSAEQKKIPLHIIVSPLISRGTVQAVIGVMRDMSLEKQQEAAKTDFVSTASHEMRTPLAALEGYLSLSLAENDPTEIRPYIDKAHQTVVHLGKLFKDLLTTSQSEDGRLSHRPEIVDLSRILQDICNAHRQQAQSKSIDLKFEAEPAAPVKADPQRLEELFGNLLDNALKYTETGGAVGLSLRLRDPYWQVRIEDDGLGIAERDLPHLFQKFYRVNDDLPGTGLGLFICKKIAELYKGEIWLESQPGKGSVFYVNLPRLPEEKSA